MQSFIKLLLYGVVIAVCIVLWQRVFFTPCDRVIKYDVGVFDDRFGLSRDDFIAHIERAEVPWETASGKQLFRYVPGSRFKVNLIFNEEQALLYESKNINNKLDKQEASISTLQTRYQSALNRYNQSLADYEKRLVTYEQEVSFWNQKGGAPREKYQALENEAGALDARASLLQTMLADVNRLAEQNNSTVQNYNNQVSDYNNLFVTGYEFDAGNTDGTEINIYSYDGELELQTLLVHEFGHVLGIDHIDDPASVMYYLLNEKNRDGHLSHIDKKALELSCNL